MKNTIVFASIIALIGLFASCEPTPDFEYFYYTPEEQKILDEFLQMPALPYSYNIEMPAHLQKSGLVAYIVNSDKAVLGRVLFYDKRLSKSGTLSCGSCHQQALAFGTDTAFSTGDSGLVNLRNTLSLGANSNYGAYFPTSFSTSSNVPFFWDNREKDITAVIKHCLTDPYKMNGSMDVNVRSVGTTTYYRPLLNKAYGDTTVTEGKLLGPLSEFVRSLLSVNSPFDTEAAKKYQASGASGVEPLKADFPAFTAQENLGKKIYMQNCASCHSYFMNKPILLSANNGIDVETGVDAGLGNHSSALNLQGTFKVPLLRNISLTAPYMHDGRFATLDAVIEHYATGIKAHPNLSAALTAGGLADLKNTDSDGTPAQKKAALKAFLLTLEDESLLVEERFGNPFK